jgi:hypothetical protein
MNLSNFSDFSKFRWARLGYFYYLGVRVRINHCITWFLVILGQILPVWILTRLMAVLERRGACFYRIEFPVVDDSDDDLGDDDQSTGFANFIPTSKVGVNWDKFIWMTAARCGGSFNIGLFRELVGDRGKFKIHGILGTSRCTIIIFPDRNRVVVVRAGADTRLVKKWEARRLFGGFYIPADCL